MLLELKKSNCGGEYVFSNPRTEKPYVDLKRAFKTACKEADISELRFHDLRHTFASCLVDNGVELITVKDLLGHSTIKMTERCTHPNKTLKSKAVESLIQGPDNTQKTVEFLAHEWHIDKKGKKGKVVTNSFSIN
jgi:integrase